MHVFFLATNDIITDHYFDLLEQTLKDNDLLEKPSQIFNCDKTGLPLNHTPNSVVVSGDTNIPELLLRVGRSKSLCSPAQMQLEMCFHH